MRADILNWTLERSTSTWKVRLYEDSCRARAGRRLPARLEHARCCASSTGCCATAVGWRGWQVDRPYLSPDEFFLRLWWSGAGTGNYRIGATFGNSETGTRTLHGRADDPPHVPAPTRLSSPT